MRTEVILLASIYQILRVNPQTLGSKLKTNRKQVLVKTSLPQSAGLSNRKKEKGATTLHILGTIILVSLLFGIAPPPPTQIKSTISVPTSVTLETTLHQANVTYGWGTEPTRVRVFQFLLQTREGWPEGFWELEEHLVHDQHCLLAQVGLGWRHLYTANQNNTLSKASHFYANLKGYLRVEKWMVRTDGLIFLCVSGQIYLFSKSGGVTLKCHLIQGGIKLTET